MKLTITREEGQILTIKDFENVNDRGEIAHFISELESIKMELIELWENYI